MNQKMILGLSGYYHDCSFCLVDQRGEVVIHCELERDARVKEIPGNPILYYLEDVFTEKYDENISGLATFLHQDSIELFTRLSSLNGNIVKKANDLGLEKLEERLASETLKEIYYILKPIGDHANRNITEWHISRFIKLMSKELSFNVYGHHHCHAAEGYFRCGSSDALVITADGGGFDFSIKDGMPVETHLTAWNGETGKDLYCIDQDHITSLGSVYDLTTSYLGFSYCYPKGSQNGSVMGMAAYGQKERFKQFYDDKYLFQSTSAINKERQKVIRSREILKESIEKQLAKSENSLQDKFDIAASLQSKFEERFSAYIFKLLERKELQKKKIIVLSGGASLNCAFVGKLHSKLNSEGESKIIMVSNVPYDGGLSIGAALLAVSNRYGTTPASRLLSPPSVFSPYLGRQYSELECISALRALRQEYKVLKNCEEIYKNISGGKVVAIFNGRSESGRRALGNRSLFADPRIKEIRDIMNKKVKHRPIWRPFAPIILEEEIEKWFIDPTKSPYMSHTCRFKPEVRDKVSSVVHADGTGRLQTVNEMQNPWLHEFMTGWKDFSGIPMLINTSFNDNEPIVETPYHAVACFKRTNIDILFFPEYSLIAYK